MTAQSIHPIKIFYCYDQEDEHLRKRLEKQLIPLQQCATITSWATSDIQAGLDRRQQTEARLDEADIILLLLSADFMASRKAEMQLALERHYMGYTRVIPILLKPVIWELTPLGDLSPLPANRKSVTMWENQEKAFVEIVKGINRVVQDLLRAQGMGHPDSDQTLPNPPLPLSAESQQQHPVEDIQKDREGIATSLSDIKCGTVIGAIASAKLDLADYTVQLHVARRGEYSTGFFVAPGYLLACAHTVQTAYQERLLVSVRWKAEQYVEAQIVRYSVETASNLAILKLTRPIAHDCLPLDHSIKHGDDLVVYGYSGRSSIGEYRFDLTCTGRAGQATPLLLLASPWGIPQGFSGAPLYNRRTRAVCGILVLPARRQHLSDCQAIPISRVQERFRELLP